MTSRPFVAAAAASILAALYFVPSASATPEQAKSTKAGTAHSTPAGRTAKATKPAGGTSARHGQLNLADTGSVDTTPYLFGGSAFLVVGAGLVMNAARRAGRA